MNPRSPSRILGICLAGAAALVVAAQGGARVLPVDEGNSAVAQGGWGAAATLAKNQKSASLAARAERAFLAQYGWGAAATYAKLHS